MILLYGRLSNNLNRKWNTCTVDFYIWAPNLPTKQREVKNFTKGVNYLHLQKHTSLYKIKEFLVQSNLNNSNFNGSFTMANSNSVLNLYEILPIDQENKYLRKLSYFIMKLYVVCSH